MKNCIGKKQLPYYVYHLLDPRDGNVFYVGKGKGNRLYQHELDARLGRITNYFKHRQIKEILDANQNVITRMIERFAEENEAYDFERREIARIGLNNLTNIVEGGILSDDVVAKRFADAATRKRKSDKMKHAFMQGLARRSAPYLLGLLTMRWPGGKQLDTEDMENIRQVFASSGYPIDESLIGIQHGR